MTFALRRGEMLTGVKIIIQRLHILFSAEGAWAVLRNVSLLLILLSGTCVPEPAHFQHELCSLS